MIFIVDDDPIQNLLTTQLVKITNVNAQLKVFNNGHEVIEGLEEGFTPRLILLDINMPIMDGWEFLKEYMRYDHQAPVCMLTSSNNDMDIAQAKLFPCVKLYLSKPVNLESIQKALAFMG